MLLYKGISLKSIGFEVQEGLRNVQLKDIKNPNL